MDEFIKFQDWIDDWYQALPFHKKVAYVLMGIWWKHISWPLQGIAYNIWYWIGEKCDWLELVYWELENEDDTDPD